MEQQIEPTGYPGEMMALTQAIDWSATPVGHADDWPQALRQTVSMLIQSNHPMFLWWGPELVQFYNDAYRKTLGPERHPIALGQRGRDCWAEIWPIIGPQIESIMGGGAATWHEDQLVPMTRNGRREDVWWTYGYSPIHDDAGVAGVLVICSDVTAEHLARAQLVQVNAQLQTEVALRRHEHDRLKVLFEQAPGFMCILAGPQHEFTFANRAYLRLIGNRDVLGKPVREAVPEAVGQGFFERLDEVYASGEPFFAKGLPIQLANASNGPPTQRFLDFVYQPIIEADGSVSGIFVQGSDVTGRKVAEESLHVADRRKDEFLAMLAHELRNPLAPISAAATLLAEEPIDPAHARMASDTIARQVTHMTGLVDDLLDASRISRGRVRLDKRPSDVRQLLAEAIEQVRPLIRARRHHLDLQQPSEPTCVLADRKRLVQVIANLLDNAAKYTEPGGTLTVHLDARDDRVVLVVRDTGIGIDDDLLPRVFDLFAQAERTADRSQGGLGIGLSLVKGIVERHGGSVSVRSAGPDAGAEFSVSLPRYHGPSLGAQAVGDQRAQTAPGRPLRIMVVDDNRDAAATLALCLGVAGHDAFAESDPLRALDRAFDEAADVCLLDIGLPLVDGNELARRIRARPGHQPLLIAVTGYGEDASRRASFEAGFDHYFVKPVETDTLLELLAARNVARAASPSD